MDDGTVVFPPARRHPFRIIAFDWDGTAVRDRGADARAVAGVIERLLKAGVLVLVITGTNYENIDRQFSSLIAGAHKRNLYICANRGSEVYGFAGRSRPVLHFRREASKEENALLSRVAEAVKSEIERRSSIFVDIIYHRLNRRKIDLIPEWRDPPKSRIDRLMRVTERRLKGGGFEGGIKGAFELAERYAREFGLADARITSDVKHIEVGLTDKSDSIKWVANELAGKRNIPLSDVLVLGDEFGPVAGFEGSDFRMVIPEESGITYVSVGKEPDGVPAGVIAIGGGPARFLRLMKEQALLYEKLSPCGDDAFLLVEEGFNSLREREIESLFAVGNGYLGTRASLEEQGKHCSPATLVAGVYDQAGSIEELVIFPDWLFTQVYVDGESLALKRKNMVAHRRVLDMRKGIYFREWRHRGPGGKVTALRFLHFASLSDPHALVLRVTVTPENYRGEIALETGLKFFREGKPSLRVLSKVANRDGKGALIKAKTQRSGITVAEALESRACEGFIQPDHFTRAGGYGVIDGWRWQAEAGQGVTIDKLVCVYTSRDEDDVEGKASARLPELEEEGAVGLMLEQVSAWERRWKTASVVIKGDTEAQRWINFASYHLISAGNPRDERVSIGARALTGPIYKGHIFWDAETFILPFFIYTHPPTARAMLMYRYHTLPAARKKAGEMGYNGALYAWESTTTGEEMTPTTAIGPKGEVIPILSGVLEQHISADVAYGVWAYWNATLDDGFLLSAGAEILIETARFWASRAQKEGDVFHINQVEGPDEYHEGVNDNIYTNMMAAWNLERAVDAVRYLRGAYAGDYTRIRDRIGLDDAEVGRWYEVACKLYMDMAGGEGLVEQFDGFFSLQDINVRGYEPRTAALDVILGRERTAASQVVKQADVVMLLYLLEDKFDEETIRKNFEYYDQRTAQGSSLSPCIYGLLAARLGSMGAALRYFHQAGQVDLADNMGNAAGGVHAAALGGLWQQVVMGFAGVRVSGEGVALCPRLPSRWRRLNFSLIWRGCVLNFDIQRGRRIKFTVEGEGRVKAGIHGRPLQDLKAGSTYVSEWDGRAWGEFSG
jgi:kojibiose phosphorylase